MAIVTDGATRDGGGGGGTSFPATTDLSMGSHKLTNLATPSASTDAATKGYIDSAIVYPWIVEINPMYASFSDVNFHDIYMSNDATAPQAMGAASGTGGRFPLNAGLFNSGAQNDEVSFNVVLGAGTWDVRLLYSKFGNAGIITTSLDGTTLGTTDCYSSPSNTTGNTDAYTGIVVASSGKKVLNLKMATKNAGSTGYYAIIHYIWLVRTA
jgi:hypothetical protein